MLIEDTVTFKAISGKDVFAAKSEDGNHTLMQISGYDVSIKFNMDYINSLDDVDEAASAMSELFKKMILQQLVEKA